MAFFITRTYPPTYYVFMDPFAMYSMGDATNFFENFEEPLRIFFQLDLGKQNGVLKLFNDRGPHPSIREFAKIVGISTSDKAEYIFQTLAILIKVRDNDPEKFINMLNKSKMPQNIKSNIVNFTTNLNEVGKNGFKMRYFIDARSVNEPALTSIRHTVFLKAVEDFDRTTVCHTPVIRLEFLFGNKKEIPEYAYMSIEQLQIMIDDLLDIRKNSAKTIETYKIAHHPDFLIVGDK